MVFQNRQTALRIVQMHLLPTCASHRDEVIWQQRDELCGLPVGSRIQLCGLQ
jgi:hypothetical protein